MSRNKEGSTRIRNGKIYARVTYKDEQGKTKEIWRKAENLTHAKQLKKQILRDLEDNGTKHIQAEQMTFHELANYYIEHYLQPPEYIDNRKIAGLRSYNVALCHFKPVVEYFSNKTIRNITYGDIKKYRLLRLKTPILSVKTPTKIIRQRSIASVNRELTYLRRAFEIAKREGWLIKNPFSQGDPLISVADERKRERILTREEEARMLAACVGARSHLRPIIICALDTGMRQGEIFKLKWKDINWATQLMTIQAFNTKTMKEREIAMTTRVEYELLALYQNSRPSLDSLVFGIEGNCRTAFLTLRKLAALPDVRFHDLRHTAATRMIQVGIPLQEVGRILGHSQAQTTFRYVNINADTAKRVALALDAFHLEIEEFNSDSEKIN